VTEAAGAATDVRGDFPWALVDVRGDLEAVFEDALFVSGASVFKEDLL